MIFTCIFGAMAPHLWLLSFKRTNHLFLNSPNPPPKFGQSLSLSSEGNLVNFATLMLMEQSRLSRLSLSLSLTVEFRLSLTLL